MRDIYCIQFTSPGADAFSGIWNLFAISRFEPFDVFMRGTGKAIRAANEWSITGRLEWEQASSNITSLSFT